MSRPPMPPPSYIARRLDALADEVERGWTGRFTEGEGFFFERTVRGVKEVAIIDDALLGSADARKLDEYAAKLQEAYPKPGLLRRKDTETAIHGPVSLFEAVTDAGRKGVALQRYKGLGEMNPEPALGNHARHQRALAAAGEDQGSRRGRRHLHQADGRRGRAAPRIHPGQFAQRQRRRVSDRRFGVISRTGHRGATIACFRKQCGASSVARHGFSAFWAFITTS